MTAAAPTILRVEETTDPDGRITHHLFWEQEFTCDICGFKEKRRPEFGLRGWTPYSLGRDERSKHACPSPGCQTKLRTIVDAQTCMRLVGAFRGAA